MGLLNYSCYIFHSNAKSGLQWAILSARGNRAADAIPHPVAHMGCSVPLTAIEYVQPISIIIKDANYSPLLTGAFVCIFNLIFVTFIDEAYIVSRHDSCVELSACI
jgi:hypothetical protein